MSANDIREIASAVAIFVGLVCLFVAFKLTIKQTVREVLKEPSDARRIPQGHTLASSGVSGEHTSPVSGADL